ncbi:MAG: phosphonate ABC transporter ATP-binding protein [Spirochaetales bacterium]|nr:phosphonate ABC transporter ATP-binding protein [Spirochaetales bacterium]
MLLQIQNVKKSYDESTHALKGVSLDVRQGEFIVIIGSSGSGKSTLLRCINQLIQQSGGSIIFKGRALEKASKNEIKKIRREIGMIFQHYNLIDRLTVIQNVLHGRLGYMSDFRGIFDLYSREDRWNAYKILERVGLAEHIHKRADQLSGGQKQRVGISRALAQNPSLMLADEPIASLDPVSSDKVMNYLYRVCHEDNIAAVVSLHQVDFALKYATRIIGLKNGLIVYDGKPEDLTQTLIDSIYENEKGQQEYDLHSRAAAQTVVV